MDDRKPSPVFFDPNQRRWPLVKGGVFALALVLSVVFGILAVSVLVNPVLPALGLPSSENLPTFKTDRASSPPRPAPNLSPTPGLQGKKLNRLWKLPKPLKLKRLPSADNRPLVAGYLVAWDDASLSTLKDHVYDLDLLMPEWLHVSGSPPVLTEEDPAARQEVLDFLREADAPLRVLPLVNNCVKGVWDGDRLGEAMATRPARVRLVQELLTFVRANKTAGLALDFENFSAVRMNNYRPFVTELAAALHKEGKLLAVHAPLAGDAYNYRRLGLECDYVCLMAYDQHWSTGAAGPVAGLDWFEENLRKRAAEIRPEKMLVVLGAYAYDWPAGGPARCLTFPEALELAHRRIATVRFGAPDFNAQFEYNDDAGKNHRVWMLDAAAAFNQILRARAARPAGYGFWRLGAEDPALWSVLTETGPLDAAAAERIREIPAPPLPLHPEDVEIAGITRPPRAGRRDVSFDPVNKRIAGWRYAEFPDPGQAIAPSPGRKKIALTFDDGPDPVYTPKILDILAREKVPAAFFVVGQNGEMHPELIRRAFDEGHEIGLHTFSHPDIGRISGRQLELELAASQRLLEGILGRQTVLFRPPYGVDDLLDQPTHSQVMTALTELGYITVGFKVDPKDWAQPGTTEIVRRTVDQVNGGAGRIVLLHDAGGERGQTVDALPELIRALRADGYELVSVASLMGRNRESVMPQLPRQARALAWVNRMAFGVLAGALAVLSVLFYAGTVLGVARLAGIGCLAVMEHRRERKHRHPENYRPTVAVIVPAYNEEKVVVQTVTSLLACEGPPGFEIIVVDDGSKDATFHRVQETFANEPRVQVYKKPNGGKPSALNFGIERTKAEIVIALDADTLFARDTIAKLVRHFVDPRVGAAAGNAKVGNRINLLTRWQALEYITCQNLDRRAFSALNCITVVPGAVGAWRRDLVIQAGGFRADTLAEDADLTLSIRRLGYRIVNEDEAVALTEAPDTVRGFIRQRYRWMFGTLQAAWKHRDTLFRPRYGSLGFVALPNIFIFQVLFPLISPVMDALMIGSLITAFFLGGSYDNAAISGGTSIEWLIFFYALFVTVDFLAAWLAFHLEPRENKGLLVWLIWQRFFYRQLMYYVAIKSTIATLRGREVGWGKLERKATVQAPGGSS